MRKDRERMIAWEVRRIINLGRDYRIKVLGIRVISSAAWPDVSREVQQAETDVV